MWRGLVWAVAWGWEASDCEVVGCNSVGNLRVKSARRLESEIKEYNGEAKKFPK